MKQTDAVESLLEIIGVEPEVVKDSKRKLSDMSVSERAKLFVVSGKLTDSLDTHLYDEIKEEERSLRKRYPAQTSDGLLRIAITEVFKRNKMSVSSMSGELRKLLARSISRTIQDDPATKWLENKLK